MSTEDSPPGSLPASVQGTHVGRLARRQVQTWLEKVSSDLDSTDLGCRIFGFRGSGVGV